jgi:hypothetical protein
MISGCKLQFHAGRTPWAAVAAICLFPWAGESPLAAQVAQPVGAAQTNRQQEEAEISQLVADLGSDDYSTREAATEELVRRGSIVAPYVRKAAESPNLEVNTRAQRILAIVSRQSFEETIEAFLADNSGQRGATLPGWERARDRLGDSPESRRLFADVYRAEPALMEAYGGDSTAVVSSFSMRVDELADRNTNRNQISYQAQSQAQYAIASNVMALLFVGADRRLDLPPVSIAKFKMLFMQSWPPQRVAAAPERDRLREWLGDLIVHRFNEPQHEGEGITLGMTYDVPRTIELAQRVMQSRNSQPYVFTYAVLCVGKYGQDWQLPLVERFLDDEAVVAQRQRSVNNQMVMYQTQLRDVALLVLVHRTDQAPSDYSFEGIDRHAEFLFQPYAVAFEDVKFRDAAIAKWHAWRRSHALFEGEPPVPYDGPTEEPSAQDSPATTPSPRDASRREGKDFDIKPLPE